MRRLDTSLVEMSVVLVTGATGLLGSFVVRQLVVQGASVVGTYRRETPGPRTLPGIRLEKCDLADEASVRSLLGDLKPTKIIHAAAAISNDPTAGPTLLRDNVLATAMLVKEAVRIGTRRFIYCSSIAVYGGTKALRGGYSEKQPIAPCDSYGLSKWIGECTVRMAASKSFEACSMRLAGLHGPGRASGVVFEMLSAARDGAPVQVRDSASRYRLLFLSDAVEAISTALNVQLPTHYRCYNVASADIIKLRSLAERIVHKTQSRSDIVAANPENSLDQVMNIDRAKGELAFKGKKLRKALAETWEWVRSQGSLAGS